MKIIKHVLPNGMTVLMEEKRDAPVISFNILVCVGSAIETDAEAGMCHVIEHMIFKGTPTRPVSAIARDVESAGGEINAYTSFDQTVFYINMASRFSDKGLEILADAVQNPLFDADELARETEVICEEIRRGKDNPSHCLSEKLFREVFTVHPYGRPIIGFEKTVKSFTRKQVLEFYQRWYAPQNMTCIIVGDFSSNEMLKKIEFAFLQAQMVMQPMPELPEEPKQQKLQATNELMEIQTSYFMMGFHIPNITHDDIAAIDILSHILAGADSSRLEQAIKEKKRLVHNIYSYAYTPKFPGIFIIGGMMQPEKTLQAIDAIWEEINKLITEPPAADELNRAKINIRASEIYERETVGGEAAKLAYFLATTDDYEFEKRYYQIINDATAEHVRAAAQRYLTAGNCTISILSPKGVRTVPTTDAIKASCGQKAKKAGAKFASNALRLKMERLQNGIKLIVRENHTLPIVSVYAAVPGGLRFERKDNNGISYLLSRTLTKGTSRRSAVDVAKKIESLAGSIDGFCGRNAMGLRTEFLSEKLYDGFGLFSEVLCDASFDKAETAKERALQIEAIHNQEDNLSSMAFVHFSKALYGKHPYGFRLLGESESVKKLSSEALKKYWRASLNPADLVISVVGDVSHSEIKKLAAEWIEMKRSKKPSMLKAMPITKPKEAIKVEHIKKGKEQAHIVLGFLGARITSPDYYRLTVLNHILAGQGGRLFCALRDRLSLAYAVNSIVQSGVEPGYFAVYIGTEPGKIETAINGIKKELKKIQSDPVSNEELERAHQYLVGTYELEQQKNGSLASAYVFNELYDLGIGEVERYPQKILKVTREDVLATARKYIDLNAYILSVIKPA